MVRFLSLSFFLSCTRDWVICQELKHVDNKVGKTTNPTALGPTQIGMGGMLKSIDSLGQGCAFCLACIIKSQGSF